ncbi:MAG TPA: response regulator [Acidobacteriota bacterium]|nr:response regulator [Acidobacteriota bacterium]
MRNKSGKSVKHTNADIQIAIELPASSRNSTCLPPDLSTTELSRENAELRAQLAEAQATLHAIREGEVDAIVVSGSQGEQIFSLTGVETVYRLIVETMKEAAFTVAFDGTILFANARFEEYVKRPMEKILGHALHELVPQDQCPAVESLLTAAQKEPVKCRLVFQGADGTLIPAFVLSNLLNQPDGMSICMVAMDLTELENSTHLIQELRRQKDALRKSQERLQLLSSCASRLLASDNPQSIINELCREVMTHLDCQAFFNFLADEQAGKLHLNAFGGISEEEALNIEWLDYGAAVCGCAARQGCCIIAEDILNVPDTRADLVRNYGIQAYCCHPLMAQGSVVGTLSFGTKTRPHFTPEEVEVMRTVADQVAVAMQRLLNVQALREFNESLEQSVNERTAEVQRQTTRLRALAAELGQAEQRERKRLASILHDHIQQLLVAAQMHLGLVKRADSMTIGPAIQGVESIIREAIDASRSLAMDLSPPILHQGGLVPALGWLANRIEEKNLFKVRVRADNAAEPEMEPVRLLLFESIRELLLNAIKYSGAHEAEIMMMRTPDDWTRITIEDKGSGFDPEVANASRNGLGLFGIQQRLTHIGGKMEIESAPGQGTRVSLLVPPEKTRKDTLEPAADASEIDEQALIGFSQKKNKICILLADDHRIVRQGLSSLLQLEPDLDIVAEAEDGEQALKLARRLKPDVVVADVSMPGMDGVELTRMLLREMPGIKVLGLCMHIEKDVAAAMRDAGAVGYLAKSGLSEDLITAIRACAAGR